MYDSNSHSDVATATRDFTVYTVRLPRDLDAAIRAEAARRFEPASVLVRRLVRLGLQDDHGGK